MAAFNDHEAVGNNLDAVRVEDDHLISGAFDYTEEMESPLPNLDADTEELDIPHFVGDLRALMVDDSEDEIVLDSDDDEGISKQKHGKTRGSLWRHAKSVDVRSSAGSNLTEIVTDNEIGNTKCSKEEKIVDFNASENLVVDDSEEPRDSSEANALEFVDHYLSINAVNLSPEVKILKHDGCSRSPFSSCAKGSQKLAMKLKTNSMNKIGVSTFNWDIDEHPDHEWDFFSEKKKQQDLGEKCKEKLQDLSKQKNDINEMDADVFEVGLDTQIAAEAMESLIYSTPPCNNNKRHQMSTFTSSSFQYINQRELYNFELPKKKVNEENLKVYKRKKHKKQDLEKENIKPDEKVNTFSPVATRTRRGSSVKCSRIDVLGKRKLGDLKFETWKWPKKKRTCRNMRENEIKGGGKCDAFLMSSVKRKKRSVSVYRSTSGKNFSMSIKMIPENLNGLEPSLESMPKDLPSNGKKKKNSTSPFIRNEVNRLRSDKSVPDFISKDLRRRRSKVEIRVLLSQSLDDDVIKHQRKILENLGICMVTDCSNATHFVADRFARTKKMLEAMGFGKQIVTPLWLESCQLAGCIIDEKNYILRDAKKEKEIGFSMPVSLSRATTHPLLKGKTVLITPNVEPGREIIENLVKAVHGQVIKGFQQMDYKTSDDVLILSCEQDYVLCVPFLDKGAMVYSSELLLNGIIIQKLEYAKHQLFKGHVIMKRYTRKRKKNGSLDLDVAHGG